MVQGFSILVPSASDSWCLKERWCINSIDDAEQFFQYSILNNFTFFLVNILACWKVKFVCFVHLHTVNKRKYISWEYKLLNYNFTCNFLNNFVLRLLLFNKRSAKVGSLEVTRDISPSTVGSLRATSRHSWDIKLSLGQFFSNGHESWTKKSS